MLRLLWLSLLFICALPRTQAAGTPAADEIVRKLIENSQSSNAVSAPALFAYTRATQVKFLEDDGTLRKQIDRTYSVTPEGGKPVVKLIAVNGNPISPRNPDHKQWQSEAGENARQLQISEELLSRFDYTLAGEENWGGRRAYVLDFHPKENPPESGGFFGKVLNELTGRMWVDQEDFQLMRGDIKLRQKVSFFGGIAGNIEKMNLKFTRERVGPGMWLNRISNVEIEGRKLFSALRFQAFEQCFEFRDVRARAAAASQ